MKLKTAPLLFILFSTSLLKSQVISCGAAHTLSICKDSTVSAWGSNSCFQLGTDTILGSRNTPIHVNNLTGIISVAGGGAHSLALKNDSTIWAWGNNQYGQLGIGSYGNSISIPVEVAGLTDIIAISAGSEHSLALKSDGTVWAWGRNCYGQLGDSSLLNRNLPTQVTSLSGIIAIDAGFFHSLVLKNDSSIFSWGENYYGCLGDSTNSSKPYPVQVKNLTGISSISAGYLYSLALKNDGTVWAWGTNDSYQLGDPVCSCLSRNIPGKVTSLTNISSITSGGSHSIAIRNDKTLWTWGNNYSGQLGEGTNTNKVYPEQITLLNESVDMSAGQSFSIALKEDRTLWSFGHNGYGQLGDSSNVSQSNPTQINSICPILSVNNEIIDATIEHLQFVIYPNPGDGLFTLQLDNPYGRILPIPLEIYNILGEEVFQTEITDIKSKIDLSTKANGLYFMKLYDGEYIHTEKIIKK